MISIIIPTLNEEKIIKQTITSLNCLTLPYEIIVSDGGSKDKTAEIARACGAKVFVHDNSYRQTIAEGRNVGGFAASGEILCFLDADCSVTEPDVFFTRAQKYFEEHPAIVAIVPSIKVLPQNATFADVVISWIMNSGFRFITNVLKKGLAPGECQIVRKISFESLNGYNKDLVTGEDGDFMTRLSRVGTVRFVPDLVVWHTGRRAHAVGWPKLLATWFINTLYLIFRGKPRSKEWVPIR